MPDVVLVHRISGLPRASFRFRLATDTLASGYALGATSCARDFHPLERAHAGHTKKRAQIIQTDPRPLFFKIYRLRLDKNLHNNRYDNNTEHI